MASFLKGKRCILGRAVLFKAMLLNSLVHCWINVNFYKITGAGGNKLYLFYSTFVMVEDTCIQTIFRLSFFVIEEDCLKTANPLLDFCTFRGTEQLHRQ